MKKIIFADFMEFNDPCNKLGNYHYAKCFAKDGYEVLWMSCLYNELLYLKHKEVYKQRVKISTPQKHKLDENIYGFAVKSRRLYGKYPFCKSKNIVLHNERFISKEVYDNLNNIGFLEVDILWISNPKQFWLTNVIKYKKLIFRIPDDFTEFGVFPNSITDIEKELIDKADIVFVTATDLMKKSEKRGKKSYLLPNGCEINHFINSKNKIPQEFKEDDFKKIIYVGAIGEWFDINLIVKLAENIKANIYIIGKEQKDLSELRKYQNVKILGARPYESIPSYIKNSNIAIIPFINNKFTDRINPIKLYEYFACNVPVVTTNMKEVVNMNSPAIITESYDDFIIKVREVLECKQDFENISFTKFAADNTWLARYEFVKKCIERETI